MITAGKALGWTRGLRFRLALSYVLFFTVLLVLLGILFRQILSGTFQSQMENVLDEEWGAAKGYLRTGPEGPDWIFDEKDPDESFAVRRVQRVYMLADTQGHPLQHSEIYDSIGIDPPSEIRGILQSGQPAIRVRKDPGGVPYMIRSGLWVDHDGHKYYLAIGRALDYNDKVIKNFTRNYFALIPMVIVLSGLLGWFLAGRALDPVNSVADAAQRITHSNLDVQIPDRNTGDELDRLIEAFNHMMTRLNHSFEQIRQFSTDVSHELRTPLTVVRGQLEVAMFTAQTVEQYREAMADALEGVERLSNIVRALLMLSQAESGQLVLQKNEMDLSGLVRDLVDQHQIPAEAEGVRLSAELPDDRPGSCMLNADRIQIERLVSNLLGNAIKYTPAGGEVKVSLVPRFDHVKLIVQDTGVGISEEHLPHIFDRFYRVPSADPEKGLGLGLSFVAWIAKAHGGAVTVESKLQQGTRFTVVLPVGRWSATPPGHAPAEAPAVPVPERVH
jgi:heavy metal sensor kinase